MNLIEKIKINCKLKIKNELYKVLSKSKYMTKESQTELYWKFKLEKNKILVVIPNDEIIYFGNEIEKTNSIDLMTNKFTYNNELYEKIASGNQIYLNTEFGTPLETNCVFTDFENKKQTKVLSLAILGNNNRSDIFAEYLQEQEIEVVYPTVLITGASRGIGAATAESFASHNYNVVINFHTRKEQAEKLKEILEQKYKIEVSLFQADISKEEEVKQMYLFVMKKYRKIDCLVNNAAMSKDDNLEEKSAKDFNQVLETNLTGTFLMCKYFGNKMKEQKKGKIINISSTNAIDTYEPYSIDYDASKAGIISLTHNFATHLAPYVNVNCIAPGWTNTENNEGLIKEYVESESKKILLKRFAEPKEIANVILFLASDEASYINNEIIRVDGGLNK